MAPPQSQTPAKSQALVPVQIQDVVIPRWQTLVISCCSGVMAWVFAHPFEMWKNTVMTAGPGVSQREAFQETVKRGPFTGLTTGMARQVVYATCRLGFYPIIRDGLLQVEHTAGLRADTKPSSATLMDRAIAGGTAGALASCLSSPVEVCLVLQTTNKGEKMSLFGAAANVYKNSGIKGFWRGIGALTSRAALVGVSQVSVHDQTLTSLRKWNGTNKKGYHDVVLVNVASVFTAFFYSIITMPVEVARVYLSAQAKLPPGAEKKYTGTLQCIARVSREQGILKMYSAFWPYFGRCGSHTVACFFLIEYFNRYAKTRYASNNGMEIVN